MEFTERPYRLGETIDLRLELKPRGGVEVREGRVDLVCEERYVEAYDRKVPVSAHSGLITGKSGKSLPIAMVPKREVLSRRESFVHSSVVVLKDARLQSGVGHRANARLKIEEEPPPHARIGKVSWKLVAAVDIGGRREVTESRKVAIELG
jgi:hypothetical protein